MTYFMNGSDLSVHPSLQALDAFARAHPEIPIIDDLAAVAVTLDREELTRAFSRIEWPPDLRVSLPRTAFLARSDLATIAQSVAGLHFPVLAKAKAAGGGTAGAHSMRFVTHPELLEGVRTPAVLQEFVNHDGVVYKIYALGDRLEAGARPSMRNIREEEHFGLDFDSQHSEIDNGLWVKKEAIGRVELPIEKFERISAILRAALNLNLIGFDILIDESGGYWLVDLNYFPGYKNIGNLWEQFLDFFIGYINSRTGQ
jgi:inositol-1,3,4-trisphosphate 5/6-kinase/inositol-tetrakisphosphate 1-kinase